MKADFFKFRPLHLVLVPLYFVTHKFFVFCRPFEPQKATSVFFWAANFLATLSFSLIPGFILFLILIWFFKLSELKAAIASSILTLFFFMESELEFFSLYSSPLLRKRYLLLICVVAVILLIRKVIRFEKFALHLNTYLNLLLTVLIIYNGILICLLTQQLKLPRYTVNAPVFKTSCTKCPDIYFIVLDAYTSNNSLQKYWKYDNSGFTEELKRNGFYVASNSRTKFTLTYYSIASILNMTNDSTGICSLHIYDAMGLVRENIVTKKLGETGYEIINLSFFNIGENTPYYGFSNAAEANEKSLFFRFINNTALKSITNLRLDINTFDRHKQTLYKLREVAEKKSGRPRFIYAHLLAPHQPYVIDSLAEAVPFYKLPKSNSASGYINQVKGLNKLIIPTIRNILAQYEEKEKPVIIIQGDHGFRYLSGHPEEGTTILNAYHFPKGTESLSDNASPYNTFRIVFREYLHADLELLKEPASVSSKK
jgi:hypothetical protein